MDDEERAALRTVGGDPDDLRAQLGQAWARLALREDNIRLGAVPRLLGTEDVNTRHDDRTPLHFVAQAAAPELVALLLDARADIDTVTDKGMLAIYLGDHVLGHRADRHCPLTASPRSRPDQGGHEIVLRKGTGSIST